MKKNLFFAKYIGRAIAMPNLKAIAQLLSKIRWGGYFASPRLNYGHTDTPVKLGLRYIKIFFFQFQFIFIIDFRQRRVIFKLHSYISYLSSLVVSSILKCSPSYCFSFSLCFLNFKLKSSAEENTIELI